MTFVHFAFTSAGPACSQVEIAEFEEFAHALLSVDYTDFLRQCNGCVPREHSDTYKSTVDLPGGSSITISQFYTLSRQHGVLKSLFEELERCADFIPVTTIPIGHDDFGNVIGLDCETGLINWTLCEQRFPLDYLRNYDLGVSFAEFVSSLRAGPYGQKA